MEKISAREQNREKEKIEEYIMLVHIVHTTAPDKLAENLRSALPGKTLDNETGDLQKLKALKAKMGGG